MNQIKVKKASGELELFSEEKVRQSLKRAGARPEVIDQIMARLAEKLYDGISTKTIYKEVFTLFNKLQKDQGYRYSLKQALMQLGPTGYPFEKFIARLLTRQGYKTETGITIQGQCVSHEVDVMAEKNGQQFLVECKFHNRSGIKTNVKVALYIQARFEDITATKAYHQPWLVTNTKLTQDAIKYGECKGMKLLAWRYPQENSLEQMIEKTGLHPLTCLGFLSQREKQILLERDIVLCQEIAQIKPELLKNWGVSKASVEKIKLLNIYHNV
jgi:Holliday junction resolvase